MAILSNPDEAGGAFTTLEDGSRLNWRQWGDPEGFPVLYCHGFPGSRLEAALAHEGALRLGLRLIAPDRPGLGGSPPLMKADLAIRADILAGLMGRLGFQHWGVLGVSAGGSYAVAVAARHPEQVRALSCVAPLVPQAGAEGMHLLARAVIRAAARHPRRFRALVASLAPVLRRHPRWGLRALRPWLPPSDQAALADPTLRRIWNASVQEGLRQGGAAAEDLRALVRPWPLDPAAITCPTRIWHGEADTQVPLGHGRWLARRIPHCRWQPVADQGHFSLPSQCAGAILEGLRDDLGSTPFPGDPR